MGEYANIKRSNIYKLLKWLSKHNENIETERGGKHQIIIKYRYWARPYPIPFKNNEVNKHIVKDLEKKLVDSQICTIEEFKNNL